MGVVGSIVGGVVSGKGAKKASKIQAQSSAEQLRLAREIYGQNEARFQTEIGASDVATQRLMAMLGLNVPAPAAPSQPTAATPSAPNLGGIDPNSFIGRLRAAVLAKQAAQNGGQTTAALPSQPAPAPAPATPTNNNSPQSITDMLRATPGYQYRLNEGLRSVSNNAYARGLGNSGATQLALMETGQNIADQGYNNYMAQLSDVINRGSGSKAAIAGVSQNFVSTANNISQNAANNAANYQMFKAQNFNNTMSNVGNVLSQVLGSSFGGGG